MFLIYCLTAVIVLGLIAATIRPFRRLLAQRRRMREALKISGDWRLLDS